MVIYKFHRHTIQIIKQRQKQVHQTNLAPKILRVLVFVKPHHNLPHIKVQLFNKNNERHAQAVT